MRAVTANVAKPCGNPSVTYRQKKAKSLFGLEPSQSGRCEVSILMFLDRAEMDHVISGV